MDLNNAIELKNVSKSFKYNVEDKEKKNIFNRSSTKQVNNKVIDDISLNIKKGEVVGLIGSNGAGKSTLLSLLARIMEPDTGTIERNGKVASILELGMGFHPDMTGRENIFLKGELYGFSKKELENKIDSIIRYSGIEHYIDNPVRTYSSGMSGRLAFSIMVNVEADIMLVDEILSIGDASFESKAREHFFKMAKSGKTVVIASHQIDNLEKMCSRIIWLNGGKIYRDGPSKIICPEYKTYVNESPEVIVDLAITGVADAQYKLALMFKDGNNFEVNEELYEQWIESAALQGHVKAMVHYSELLMSKGNVGDAINYLQTAANKGDNDARLKLASLRTSKDEEIQCLLSVYKQLASSGNALYECRYAELLLKTAWNTKDRSNAFMMYKQSADDGNLSAMHQTGLMYRDSIGTPRDIKKMKEYLTMSAEKGFMPSIVLLADLYAQGSIIPKSEEQCFKWTLKAAELGNGGFMYKVATMYRDGIGVEKNIKESDKWFRKYQFSGLFWLEYWAADNVKNKEIQSNLSAERLYERTLDGINIPIIDVFMGLQKIKHNDREEIIDRIRFLSENGNTEAKRRLGQLYYDGVFINQDYSTSIRLFEECAVNNDNWCRQRLGEMYRDGKGVQKDVKKAIEWFKLAGEQGSLICIFNIMNLTWSGDGADTEEYGKALKALERYAEGGSQDAICKLGNMYHDGTIAAQDYSKALYWYTKGADVGNVWCRQRCSQIQKRG